MDFIGAVPKQLWDLTKGIAKNQAYPQKQPQSCPYIILKKINNKQILVMDGYFKKGSIELFICEVCSPGVKRQDRVPILESQYDEAREYAQELLSRAITQSKITHSTVNES